MSLPPTSPDQPNELESIWNELESRDLREKNEALRERIQKLCKETQSLRNVVQDKNGKLAEKDRQLAEQQDAGMKNQILRTMVRDRDTQLAEQKERLIELERQVVEKDTQLAEKDRQLAAQEDRLVKLNDMWKMLKRSKHGPSTEKRLQALEFEPDDNLFTASGQPIPEPNRACLTILDGGKSTASGSSRPSRRGRGGKLRPGTYVTSSGLRFGPDVPVKEIIVPVDYGDLCEQDFVEIGKTEVNRLAEVPARYMIVRYIYRTVKRRDGGEIRSAPVQPGVLGRSSVDVSFLAGSLIDKHLDHMPLYRQHQRLLTYDIMVSRTTFLNWHRKTLDKLKVIYEAQFASVVSGNLIAMDETSIRVGRTGRDGKHGMFTSYLWPMFGDRNEIVFAYTATRNKENVAKLLKDFKGGTLLTDGYQAYTSYTQARENIRHAQCWVHCRRNFAQADRLYAGVATPALDLIGAMYVQEKKMREGGLQGADKLAWRQQHSKPLVNAFFDWCECELNSNRFAPSHRLTKALNYALKRRPGLEMFLSNDRLAPDTNYLERLIRPIAVGRKNWMFAVTELGAEHIGIAQSLLRTCLLHEVDPRVWLVDVLLRLDSHKDLDIKLLTPRLWKTHFGDNPLRSVAATGIAVDRDGFELASVA